MAVCRYMLGSVKHQLKVLYNTLPLHHTLWLKLNSEPNVSVAKATREIHNLHSSLSGFVKFERQAK